MFPVETQQHVRLHVSFDWSLTWRLAHTRQAAEQLFRELSDRQELELGPADPATQQSQYHCAVLCEQVCSNATPVWRFVKTSCASVR